MHAATRTPRLYAVTGLVLTLAWTGGCGSISRRSSSDASFATDGTNVLSASADDPVHGQYELVAQELSATSGAWEFSVRTARANDKSQYTFEWDFDDGTVSSGTSQIHTFSEPGTYTITVRAIDFRGSVAFVLSLIIEIPMPTNDAPIADAGADQTVNENGLVFLYAGRSFDANGDEVTYEWTQLSGPPVNLLQANAVTASFVAPLVDVDTLLEFQLTVSDGELSSTDIVVVEVLDVVDAASLEPVAKAGPDQTVVEGTLVTLDGTASEGGGGTLSFEWTQVSGPSVVLSQRLSAMPTFVAPMVELNAVQLVFELAVTRGDVTAVDEVVVTVVDATDGPNGDPCATDTDADGTADCDDGCPNDPQKTAAGICGCGQPDVDSDGDGLADCLASGSCLTGSTTWQNMTVSAQAGTFTAEFDVTPQSGGVDGIVALSLGEGTTFGDFAVLVRFNVAGAIDARNGSVYSSDTTVSYVAGHDYHLRLDVNVPQHLYSVFVKPAGSSVESRVAGSYAFRTESATVGRLDNLGVWAGSGSIDVCNFTVDANGPLLVGAGSDKTLITGSSVVLDGTVSGGTGIYNITWSPATGLSDAHALRPTASPTSSTTYTLSVTDSEGQTGSDPMRVTVQTAPLTVDAGADASIPNGGSVQLGAVAVGGQPPYTYRWSPTTGLSSSSVAAPLASPTATTSYTLTVTDNAGTNASDTVVVSVVDGTVYFVDKNGAGASDANPGTEASPWKTLAKAAATAQSGDTVYVKAGTYYETLRPLYSGAIGAPITFAADPVSGCRGGKTKSACGVVIDGGGTRESAAMLQRSYIRVEGFEMTNHGGGLLAEVIHVDGVGIQIVNNYIHDNDGSGVVAIVGNSIGLLVDNNEMRNVYRGVLFNGNAMTFRNNHIWAINCDGIRGGGDNTLIEGNDIHSANHGASECHMDALDLGAGETNRGLIIRNNTIYDFSQLVYIYGYSGSSVENIEIYGNVIYNDKYWTDFGGETQGVFIDARRSTTSARNIAIHSNTFVWLGYDAVWVLGVGNNIANVSIRNNILYQAGLTIESVTSLDADYNLYYQSNSNVGLGPHSFFADPKFVNYTRHVAYNVRLQADSPAVDTGSSSAGTVSSFPTPFTDQDGRLRPANGAYDIGAYER